MHSQAYASLLDDPAFEAALERIDLPVDAEVIAFERAQQKSRVLFRQQLGPAVDNDVAPNDGDSQSGSPLTFAGFLLLMMIGGAAAALVFAERIAMLLLGK